MRRSIVWIALWGMCLSALIFAAAPAQSQGTPTATPQATPADPLGGATEFAKAPQPTDVTIMLDWTPNTNHLGLYVAQAKGFYEEANLNVTIQPAGDISPDQVVVTGRAQFGISYQEGLSYSRASGLPLISLAAIIQHNTSGFASLADRHPLRSPADLVGLRYGGYGSAIEKPIIDALIACVGKDPATDSVQVIDIGFVEPWPLMAQDRIDFVWLFYAWDGLRAQQQGLNVSFLMLRDYPDCVPDFYTPILMASEEWVAQNPEVTRAFVQATARGYAAAIQDPAGAAEILLAAAPDLDATLVKASAEWLAGQFQADAPRWGEQRLEVWQAFTEFMRESGAVQGEFDPARAFTNDYLPGE